MAGGYPCCDCGGQPGSLCCPGGVPATLHATLSNLSGCACVDGIVVPLTFNPNVPPVIGVVPGWFGQVPASCAGENPCVAVHLVCCSDGTWHVHVDCAVISCALELGPINTCIPGPGNVPLATGSCAPLHLSGNVPVLCGSCGLASIVVTL